MSDAVVQKGTALKVGFGSFAATGYIPEDGLVWRKARDVEEVTDENNAVVTMIISRPRDEFDLTLIVKDAGGDITPPTAGSEFSLTDPDGSGVSPRWAADPQVTFNRNHTRLSGTAVLYPDVTGG